MISVLLMEYKFSIRLVVADDRSIVREELVLIQNNQDDMTVVGECGDEKQAVELVLRKNPDVAILDLLQVLSQLFRATT